MIQNPPKSIKTIKTIEGVIMPPIAIFVLCKNMLQQTLMVSRETIEIKELFYFFNPSIFSIPIPTPITTFQTFDHITHARMNE